MQGGSQIFEFDDLWQLGRLHLNISSWRSIQTHVLCPLSLLFTLSFLSSPRLPPPTAPITTPARLSPMRTARHHLRTKSANVLFSVSESIMMKNRKGLKADPWWSPTSTAGFTCSCSTPHYSFALMARVLHQSDTLLWYPLSRMHQYSSSLGTLSYIFFRSTNTQCKSCCPSLYLSYSCLRP